MDDAIRAGIIKFNDIPINFIRTLGDRHSKRIDTMVRDVIFSTIKTAYEKIRLSEEIEITIYKLRDFLFDKVYLNDLVTKESKKAKYILQALYNYYFENPYLLFGDLIPSEEEIHRAVCDFIAGMTDRYALYTFEKIFMPKSWVIS